jgi:hypothetical protein
MMDSFSRYRTPAIFGSILLAPQNGDGDRTTSHWSRPAAVADPYASKAAVDGTAAAGPFNRPQPG